MPARKQLLHPKAVKQEILTSELIRRLQEHALSDEELLTRSQLRAIEILLGKTIPDLRAIEHGGGLTLTHEDALAQLDGESGDARRG